jgi:molybdopterin converting factor small subunit
VSEVTVRWYAQLRDWRGRADECVSIADGETIEALYTRLVPAERRVVVRFAVGDRWAQADRVLVAGDEVVFLPPVGGG